MDVDARVGVALGVSDVGKGGGSVGPVVGSSSESIWVSHTKKDHTMTCKDELGNIWLPENFLYNEITSPVTPLYITMFVPSAQTQAEVGDAKPIAYRLVGLVFLWIISNNKSARDEESPSTS